jgi:prepilin-type N-terminal cleavage/methylation domain-containing protein
MAESTNMKPAMTELPNSASAVSRFTFQVSRSSAFTLLELLTVIAIVGILAAIALPTLNAFKPNPLAAASRQMLDDLAYARHKAIADHTTVYVVFMPPRDNLEATILNNIDPVDQQRMAKAQYVSYALYEKRNVGDQPGQGLPHWITGWRKLPQGVIFAPQKFGTAPPVPPAWQPSGAPAAPAGMANYATQIHPFNYTNAGQIFSSPENSLHTNSHSQFPTIAFSYSGGLAQLSEQWILYTNNLPVPGYDCVIPLMKANISPTTNWAAPTYNELMPGSWNDVNLRNWIVVDGPTGRARIDRAEIK